MTQDVLQERWVEIADFPGYSVSDGGQVLKEKTGLHVAVTKKAAGYPMVGLMLDGVQYKRSLPLLVARAFLPEPPNESYDSPIQLDGDRGNCRSSNLMWRPLWFGRRYMKQFTDDHLTCHERIEDVESRDVYDNSMHAAVVNGLLDYEIYLSMMNNSYVWPTGQVFRKAVES